MEQTGLLIDVPDVGEMVRAFAGATGVDEQQAIHTLITMGGTVAADVRGTQFPVTVIPGHKHGGSKSGPQPSDIMVLLSHPYYPDTMQRRYLSGGAGLEFMETCASLGLNPASWYITSAVKFTYPLGRKQALKPWVDSMRPLFLEELRRVNPKYILAGGSHVLKFLFGTHAKISQLRGTVLNYKGIPVIPILSPNAVTQSADNQPQFRRDMSHVAAVIKGEIRELIPTRVNLIADREDLWDWVEAMQQHSVFSVDCEWGGRSPQSGGLRTIQVCHKPGEVAVLHLRNERMEQIISDEEAAEALRMAVCREDVRVVGHFFRSDLLWLRAIGVDMLPQFLRGLDTILAAHALYPNLEMQLELICNSLIGEDRYDLPLRQWADANSEDVDRFAYSHVPDDILIPYAARDADKTLQLAGVLVQKLNAPGNEGLKRLVYKIAMPASEGILMMEEQGLLVDMDRFAFFEHAFKEKHDFLEQAVRDHFNWPDFNPGSWQQKNDLLFGSEYNGTRGPDGKPVRLRPENVPCLKLTPIKTTGKPTRMWEEVVESGTKGLTPSSDNETLGMLAEECPALAVLRDERYLAKTISNFMPDPKTGKDGTTYYKSGIRLWRDLDGYIRTHISQLAETGRWRSFDPNQQNLRTRRL